MDKRRAAIETIVEHIDPVFAEKLRGIDSLSMEERRKEYMGIISRIDKGRKEGKCRRGDAILFKDAMAQVYDQHPNSSDPILLPNLVRGAVIVGLFYFIGNFEKIYQGIIKPTIEYFFK